MFDTTLATACTPMPTAVAAPRAMPIVFAFALIFARPGTCAAGSFSYKPEPVAPGKNVSVQPMQGPPALLHQLTPLFHPLVETSQCVTGPLQPSSYKQPSSPKSFAYFHSSKYFLI